MLLVFVQLSSITFLGTVGCAHFFPTNLTDTVRHLLCHTQHDMHLSLLLYLQHIIRCALIRIRRVSRTFLEPLYSGPLDKFTNGHSPRRTVS